MERKFDLMFCCLGNGTTVCNRAVMEHGDYKIIAHIDPCGAYRVRQRLPEDVIEEIEKMARSDTAEFKKKFLEYSAEYWYEKLLDEMSYAQYRAWRESEDTIPHETPEQLYELYVKNFTERSGYTMPKIND